MKIEYYGYYPVVKTSKFYPHGDRKYLRISDIRKQLPSYIVKELMEETPSQNANSICVETKKIDVVEYLDKLMQVKKNNFTRRRFIEITEEEIENYDYFRIDLRLLDWGKQINYDIARPTCVKDACPYGAQRTSPTRIKSKSIRSLNLGRIGDMWGLNIRFVISEKLKGVFDSEGITGLKYEPCLLEHQKGKKGETQTFEGRLYVAEITRSIAERASDIFLHYYCKKHSLIIAFDICNVFAPQDAILPYDFQMINRVIVKGKEYYYGLPSWFVSRKVLNILLKHKIADLRPVGQYFKKNFTVVPFD